LRVATVVPFCGGCRYREAAWRWVRGSYAEFHPDWDLIEAPAPPGRWCKATAVNPAVETCDAEIVIQADADVWCDRFPDAVAAVEAGASWAVPHKLLHRLSEDATQAVLAGGDWQDQEPEQKSYEGILGGGIVVARREVLSDVPLDRRFVGWGQEDEAHAFALNALYGDPWRGTADLVHLWHPPQPRDSRRKGSRESWRLRRRYFEARRKPMAIRALLEEGR
jgi:hypothetical protein